MLLNRVLPLPDNRICIQTQEHLLPLLVFDRLTMTKVRKIYWGLLTATTQLQV